MPRRRIAKTAAELPLGPAIPAGIQEPYRVEEGEVDGIPFIERHYAPNPEVSDYIDDCREDERNPERSPLLPVRHPEDDFFVCDIMDAVPKDDMGSMEHPLFSLSTRPDTRLRTYENKGVRVEIIPSAIGLATIHDKDILIYAISQLVAGINRGETPRRTLHIKAYDLLVNTNRETSGDGYRRLKEAFERLRGTTIVTNIKSGGEEITEGFGLIENWRIVRETKSGRMSELKVTLSEWLYNIILGREVLTLHKDYFRLRKPIERRMYELARKHCGQQTSWTIGLELLQKKCGSNSPIRVFRSLVKKSAERDQAHSHFPDYAITMIGDRVTFTNRKTMPIQKAEEEKKKTATCPPLDPETYHDARTVAPGWDVYYLEREWRDWMMEPPRDANAAFIGFCRKWFEKRGEP